MSNKSKENKTLCLTVVQYFLLLIFVVCAAVLLTLTLTRIFCTGQYSQNAGESFEEPENIVYVGFATNEENENGFSETKTYPKKYLTLLDKKPYNTFAAPPSYIPITTSEPVTMTEPIQSVETRINTTTDKPQRAAPETSAPPETTVPVPDTSAPETQKPEETTVVVTVTEPDADVSYKRKFKLTAYCPCRACSGKWGNMTSTGVRAVPGRTIAVCPSQIPYGSRVYIEGYGTYIAEDCGVGWDQIDIYFATHSETTQFGVRYAYVSW